MMSEFLEKIQKTREYLDYLERHYNNVQRAWAIVKIALQDQPVIFDDFRYFSVQDELKEHDLSKLSCAEFMQYRRKFFPTNQEKHKELADKTIDEDFAAAWENHKAANDHHWENWTTTQSGHPYYREWACTQMICDWVAMSLEFKEISPRAYYEKINTKVQLPTWAERDLLAVCDYMESHAEGKGLCRECSEALKDGEDA